MEDSPVEFSRSDTMRLVALGTAAASQQLRKGDSARRALRGSVSHLPAVTCCCVLLCFVCALPARLLALPRGLWQNVSASSEESIPGSPGDARNALLLAAAIAATRNPSQQQHVINDHANEEGVNDRCVRVGTVGSPT